MLANCPWIREEFVRRETCEHYHSWMEEDAEGKFQTLKEQILKAQYDIIYIKNTKKLRSGMVTDEFADDLILASDNVFCKRQADAFSSEELISYLKSKGVSEIEMIGVDGNLCIKASAKGAVKCGFIVSILLSCVGVSNLPRFEKTKEDLEK